MKNREFAVVVLCMSLFNLAGADDAPPTALKLIPAAEAVPTFKHRLLPELRDQTPGNVVTGYYRAYSPEWQGYRREPKWSEMLDKAMEMPGAQLRGSEEAKKLEWLRSSSMLREVDRAARRSYCDWELTDRIREEGISLLLPDLQGLREIARLLAVRARLEMADGNFDAAAKTLQTGYALARHIGEGPSLIHGLVGIAVASVMNKQVEAWMQTPGSTNLYWSLTDLPVSMIDLRKCLQGERIWIDSMLPQLRQCLKDPTRPPLSQEQMNAALKQFSSLLRTEAGETQATVMLLAAAKYTVAKKFLADHGWTAAQIEAMPALQAVFMHELYDHDRLFDLLTRGANLPYHQGHKVLLEADEQLKREVAGPWMGSSVPVPIVAKLMLPAINKVISARTRLDRQIAALRTVEAIRLFAAAHDGKLPASLDAITAVPLPLDPITGQAFQYTLTGDKALLIGSVPAGETPNMGIRYEITSNN